mmetsp:Transcript_4661/g.11764  ORF Transcript_4661/g.11764 Transcript_4661/m.11764 type:complete len:324 (+) Transcript_4661:29-1000(+)|eukprot:CAMPEP_0206237696 /NCGR_PEP_ID=MMETSP0047_2-20121206/14405_1 /ASSEMBLY_ACC=CAM_ASM_000192 /TAXON_ID=195065 /ORGANISM="Chroomonas mesostigmatica_cf, Strain CCMP1168" /LENGTH=323 /DNA_ID=CAMNT_0053662153 /DNA_START=25 /DNA_END=996 /DNA_ORIENTATION=+
MACRKPVRQLNPSHNEAVKRYIRFTVLQRNQELKDLQMTLADYKDSRLGGDDTFSADEVRDMLDSLGEILRADVYRGLQRVSHSNVVLLQQVIGQAEDGRLGIAIDTSLLEDEALLEEAAALEKDSEKPTPAALEIQPAQSLRQKVLPSMDSHKQAETLEVEKAQLKVRLGDLQHELTGVNREKTDLRQKLQDAEDKLKTLLAFAASRTEPGAEEKLREIIGDDYEELQGLGSDENVPPPQANIKEAAASASGNVAEMLADLKEQLRERSQAAQLAEEALEARLDQAPQFRNLKDMLTKKNAQIKYLREQLAELGWTDPEEGP